METPIVPVVSNPVSAPIAPKAALTNEVTSVKRTALPSEASVPAASTAASAAAPVATTVTPAVTAAAIPANLANVDLGKISSILNSIMKNTGVLFFVCLSVCFTFLNYKLYAVFKMIS